MDPNSLWHFQELFRRVGWLAERQLKLEGQLTAVEEQLQTIGKQLEAIQGLLAGLDSQPSTRIDKIEYRFEQLKVDTLSGSLQIGLTHGAEGLIEDLKAGKITAQDIQLQDEEKGEPYATAAAAVENYTCGGLYGDIDAAAREAGAEIGDELRQRMALDLTRQARDRAVVYMKEVPTKEGPDDSAVAAILDKVRADVQAGLKQFFSNYGKESAS